MSIRKDLSGLKFNRLTVVGENSISKHGAIKWNCMCECGNASIVRTGALKSGQTKSCGCAQKEAVTKHGMTRTRTHNIWRGMRQRCVDKNSKDYARYGAIGISVCERWEDFSNFLADMGKCPQGMTIERIDNTKGYGPENCKWASWLEQSHNRTNNHSISIGGERLLISQWAKRLGVGDTVIPHRLAMGWDAEKACSTPVKPRNLQTRTSHTSTEVQ